MPIISSSEYSFAKSKLTLSENSKPGDFPLWFITSFYCQGFKDTSLSVWDASCILKHYEEWTGHILTREELDSGFLASQLIELDYNLEESVSFQPYSPIIPLQLLK